AYQLNLQWVITFNINRDRSRQTDPNQRHRHRHILDIVCMPYCFSIELRVPKSTIRSKRVAVCRLSQLYHKKEGSPA
ncbi:hypothetical protein V3C99_001585, partial [Haemonchus contortus]